MRWAGRRDSAIELFTIGHGAVELDTFLEYCRDTGLVRVVDVRRFPGSRRHPQFSQQSLRDALEATGIAYEHAENLGGRRRVVPDSRNLGLRNAGFRGYADWMDTGQWREAFARVMDEAASQRLAVMCAETLWWRCHRRLIADAAVLLRDASVTHVVSGSYVTHKLTAGVTRDADGTLSYQILSNDSGDPGVPTA